MLHALPVVHPVRVMELIWGVHLPVEYVIRLQLMAGVYRFSRYFLQMNVFMIANTVSTDALMMLKECHLRLRRYVSLLLSFTDAII